MKWEPDNFQLEKSSVWSFPTRGSWATHDSKYRGNCSPYVVRNLILRYTKETDWILDQFVGGGTSLVEAKLLDRNIIGADINSAALHRCKIKTNFNVGTGKIIIKKADARNLYFIKDRCIDFICTHPPYANIIKYSDNNKSDLSLLEYDAFLSAMDKVALEAFRVLKKGKYCTIIMGDIRRRGFVYPLGFTIMKLFENVGFKLKEILIKQQHNCRRTSNWEDVCLQKNFFLLTHEYIFVFKK